MSGTLLYDDDRDILDDADESGATGGSHLPMISSWLAANRRIQYTAMLRAVLSGTEIGPASYALASDADAYEVCLRDASFRQGDDIRRRNAAGLDMRIVPHEDDGELGQEFADVLTELHDQIVGATEARYQIASAIFRGVSVAYIDHEARYETFGGIGGRWIVPTRIIDVDPRRYRLAKDPHTGKHKRQIWSTRRGTWMDIDHTWPCIIIVYNDEEARLGYGRGLLDTIFGLVYAKRASEQLGLSSLETYAHGIWTAKLNGLRQSSAGREGAAQITKILQWVENMRRSGTGAHGEDVELSIDTPQTGGSSDALEREKWYSDQILQVSLGASMQAGGGGDKTHGGKAQAEVEQDTADSVVLWDRRKLDEEYTYQVLGWLRRVNAGNLQRYAACRLPRFTSDAESREKPSEVISLMVQASQVAPIVESEWYDRLGLSVPADDDKTVGGPQQQGGGEDPFAAMLAGAGGAGGAEMAAAEGVEEEPADASSEDDAETLTDDEFADLLDAEGDDVEGDDVPQGAATPTDIKVQDLRLALTGAVAMHDRALADALRRKMFEVLGQSYDGLDDATWAEMVGSVEDDENGDLEGGGTGQFARKRGRAAIGEVRTRKDGSRWRKVADGKWEPVRDTVAVPPARSEGGASAGEAVPAVTGAKRARVAKVAKAIWQVVNAAPTAANAVVKETGAGPRVVKAAYAVSLVGDYAVPGLPAGSVFVALLATVARPGAPVRAARKAIAQFRSRKAQSAADAPSKPGETQAARMSRMFAVAEWAAEEYAGGGAGGPEPGGGMFASDDEMDADEYEEIDDAEWEGQFAKAAEIGERRTRKDGSVWEKRTAKSWVKVKAHDGSEYTRQRHSRKPIGTKVTRRDGSEWEKVGYNSWKRTKPAGGGAAADDGTSAQSGVGAGSLAIEAITGREPSSADVDRLLAAAEASEAYPDPEQWGTPERPLWRPGPNPTVDAIVTRQGADGQEVLLIQRGERGVEAGKWAIPGGFHDSDTGRGQWWKPGKETTEEAGIRELAEETGLDASSVREAMRHVGTYDKQGRDPRDSDVSWTVTNAFRLDLSGPLADAAVKGMDDAANAEWVPVSRLGKMDLAFDHAQILRDALDDGGSQRMVRYEDSDRKPYLLTPQQRESEIKRLRDEYSEALSTGLASEGAISPVQIGRMPKKQREKWQRLGQVKLYVQSLIRELSDPESVRKDDERKASKDAEEDAKVAKGHIKYLHGLGSMAYDKRGRMRKGYRKTVDEYVRKLRSAIEVRPDLASEYDSLLSDPYGENSSNDKQ